MFSGSRAFITSSEKTLMPKSWRTGVSDALTRGLASGPREDGGDGILAGGGLTHGDFVSDEMMK